MHGEYDTIRSFHLSISWYGFGSGFCISDDWTAKDFEVLV